MIKNISHSKHDTEVTREELREIQTPEPTRTWFPVDHGDLLEAVIAETEHVGLKIKEEKIIVSHAKGGNPGDRMLAMFELENDRQDLATTIAVLNAHDQSFACKLVAGMVVTCCTNLAMGGEASFARKHTKNAGEDVNYLVYKTLGRLKTLHRTQDEQVARYQATALSDTDAHELALRAIEQGVLSPSKTLRVLKEYHQSEHKEFQNHDLWALFNAFTECLKGSNLFALPRKTQTLHSICDRFAAGEIIMPLFHYDEGEATTLPEGENLTGLSDGQILDEIVGG